MALPGAPPLDPSIVDMVSPLVLAGERLLPVPGPLEPLFGWGGIQRGWSIGVAGEGAWSLAMSLWAEALGPEGWVAVVGVPDLNLATAAELGVRLDRVVVVETPPASQWSTVMSTLVETFDIVAINPIGDVGIRDARRLSARARERGAVMFHLDGGSSWPTALDLTLTCSVTSDAGLSGWSGLGYGHGHIQFRQLNVDAIGRRTGRPKSARVQLPDVNGALASCQEAPLPNRQIHPALGPAVFDVSQSKLSVGI